jgi:hypothetical protein
MYVSRVMFALLQAFLVHHKWLRLHSAYCTADKWAGAISATRVLACLRAQVALTMQRLPMLVGNYHSSSLAWLAATCGAA